MAWNDMELQVGTHYRNIPSLLQLQWVTIHPNRCTNLTHSVNWTWLHRACMGYLFHSTTALAWTMCKRFSSVLLHTPMYSTQARKIAPNLVSRSFFQEVVLPHSLRAAFPFELCAFKWQLSVMQEEQMPFLLCSSQMEMEGKEETRKWTVSGDAPHHRCVIIAAALLGPYCTFCTEEVSRTRLQGHTYSTVMPSD